MPTYEWRCEEHGTFERTFRMADKPKTVPCPNCGQPTLQIPNYGGIQSDEPAWLFTQETLGCLQKPGERPIQSRSEWKRYMRDRGIVCRN